MDKNSDFESQFDNLDIESDYESIDSEYYDNLFEHFMSDTNSWFGDQTIDEEVDEVDDYYIDDHISYGMKLTDLNEYCFMHLFTYLSFNSLMKLRSVSKQLKNSVEEYLKSKRRLRLINSFANQNINIETSKNRVLDLIVIANDCYSDQILLLMTELCPNLEALELIYITIDDPIVEILTKHFYDVNDLSFAHPLGLTEDSLQTIVHYFGPQLLGLTIADSDLSEDCLEAVVAECPNLQLLDVSGNPDITGDCFRYLNNNLLTLRLSQCDSIRESGLQSLVKSESARSLSELVISGLVCDYMIGLICKNMPQLRSFQCVYGCTREMDSKIDHLSVIGQLTKLERLSLQEIDAYFGSLDDKSLLKIISCCNRLKYLELHVGSGERLLITDRYLSLISDYCPQIECLKLYNFEAVTDKSLNSFSKLVNLKELELINLYNISDEGVAIITERCSQLTKLYISFDGNCDSITNLTLIACIDMCRRRPKQIIDVNFFETCITVPFNQIIPQNMRLRVSWYRPTPEGRRYTEIKLPDDKPILSTQ